MMRFPIAAFLLGFAAVHGGYEQSPAAAGAPSYWQGNFGQSWLLSAVLPDEAVRVIANLPLVLPMAGLVAAGLGLLGLIVPQEWCRSLVIASAAGSLALALLFWHPYQWLSAAADIGILAVLLGTDLSFDSLFA